MGRLTKEQYIESGTRPSWDEYFLGIAESVSVRGDCRRSRVGAVLVTSDQRHLGSGYNGTVQRKDTGCLAGGCPRGLLTYDALPPGGSYANCGARHAEANAIFDALEKVGRRALVGTTMYITREPCNGCWDLMEEHGVSTAVWDYWGEVVRVPI